MKSALLVLLLVSSLSCKYYPAPVPIKNRPVQNQKASLTGHELNSFNNDKEETGDAFKRYLW